jgi:hypothetical protein
MHLDALPYPLFAILDERPQYTYPSCMEVKIDGLRASCCNKRFLKGVRAKALDSFPPNV